MAVDLIESDWTIKALKCGAGRLSDGGGLYVLLFAAGRPTTGASTMCPRGNAKRSEVNSKIDKLLPHRWQPKT